MNLNGGVGGRRSPAGSGALGGSRSRPALNVNTLFQRRKQKDAKANANGTTGGALNPASSAAAVASATPSTQLAAPQEEPRPDNSIDGRRFVV